MSKPNCETSYYPEIMSFIKTQIESNFKASNSRLKVYFKTGELCSKLHDIIIENNITATSIVNFAESTPPLSLDIFGLITDGTQFELLILEVKLKSSVGLTQLSQLIGYCIVSKAEYGLLINIDGGESKRFSDLLVNEHDLTHIVRTLNGSGKVIEHNLGVMEWDSVTKNLNYTGTGAIRTISELCKKIENKFNKNKLKTTY